MSYDNKRVIKLIYNILYINETFGNEIHFITKIKVEQELL